MSPETTATIMELQAEGSGSENIGMLDRPQDSSHSGEGAELNLWRERSHKGSPPRDLLAKYKHQW